MKIAARTDAGLVRENNQDSYTACELDGGTVFAVRLRALLQALRR